MIFCKLFKQMRLPLNKIGFIGVISIFAVLKVFADDSHSKSVLTTSKARIISPISIENTGGQGLDFGMIAVGTAESKVVVSAEATVTVNVSQGDAVVITSTQQKAAKFTVTGEVGKTYTITLPTSATLTSGVNSLTVTNFTCSNGVGGNIGTNDLFYVGGELTIPAGVAPAIYLGTFSVAVVYN
jgi:hypothetical protein